MDETCVFDSTFQTLTSAIGGPLLHSKVNALERIKKLCSADINAANNWHADKE